MIKYTNQVVQYRSTIGEGKSSWPLYGVITAEFTSPTGCGYIDEIWVQLEQLNTGIAFVMRKADVIMTDFLPVLSVGVYIPSKYWTWCGEDHVKALFCIGKSGM